MTLRHLKTFVTVCQMENITKAAKALNLTQPAVTRTIQEIEKYYGVCLFERINRRLHITEAGKVFYTYALHIIDSFDQMEMGLRSWDEQGVIRVGATITLGNSLLPQTLKRFRQEHPGVQIQATISNGRWLQQALLDNQLDIALIEGDIQNDDLCRERIAQDKLVLILPPEDPRKDWEHLYVKDLADGPFLLREEGSMGRSLIDRVFTARKIPVHPLLESVSTQAIVRAVHEGLGISFLPEHLVEENIASGFVATKTIEDQSFERDNYIVWHRQKFLTGSAKALIELARAESYADEAPKME